MVERVQRLRGFNGLEESTLRGLNGGEGLRVERVRYVHSLSLLTSPTPCHSSVQLPAGLLLQTAPHTTA